MDEVKLSTNEFKALSSTTRTNLLKILAERNFTLSELASKTGMAAPTVKQHTAVLMDAGLIEVHDEGRKWKYYALTKKGKKIIESKERQTNIMIILSSTIIVALLGVAILSAINMPMMGISDSDAPYERATILPNDTIGEATPQITGEEIDDKTPTITAGSRNKKCTAIENKTFEEECSTITDENTCLQAEIDTLESQDCKWEEFVN